MKQLTTALAALTAAALLLTGPVYAAAPKKKPAPQPPAQTVKWGKEMCAKAEKALASGDYEKARDIYSQVLWKLPASPKAKDGLKKAEAAIRGKQNREQQEALNKQREGAARAHEALETEKRLREEAGITDEIVWSSDYEQGLAMAKQRGQKIMIDCTAAWCPWCVRLDKRTWADPQVIAASRSFICLKIPDKDKATLSALGGVNSYPTIIFMGPDGQQIKKIEGFVEAPQMLKAMNEALGQGQGMVPAAQ